MRILPGTLALLLTAAACGSSDRIVVGGKNFTEQDVLAELVAQQIERRTGIRVVRRFHLGGTFICHHAITAGDIDVYVEYTGTAYTAILDHPTVPHPDTVYARAAQAYREQWDLEWLPPLGFNNTFALIVRPGDAERLRLRSLSDLAPHASDWRVGFGFEFEERPDGYRGLTERYGFRFGTIRTMDLGLLYRALEENEVDVIVANSTDGLISALGLVVLDDDLAYFPPYHAAPVVRQEVLEKYPAVGPALRALAGKIGEEEMRRLNYEVDGNRRPVDEVVREWLDENLPMPASDPPGA